ncbi:putative late blight resistance protein homolog R1B-17 isoform X2 [Salvia splendens]|uniref:putative late blight resistance protein homolog R1B-17 isoform X2 n=1 Tax=Salvia splendens TaxID=180675 RepID=UPI001C277C5E|nr:putative late blight resistance protein homolog R1B-17 isoform X2 [Salvia splendens]
MAAYAALVSLAQTTTRYTNHAKSQFSIDAKQKIGSIYDYAIMLLTFLEDYSERSNRWEGKLRDLAHEAEDIIEQYMSHLSYNRWIKPSELKFEDQLSNVTQKLGLMVGDLMENLPAHSPLDVSSSSSLSSSSSSRVAPAGKSRVVGLDGDVIAVKERLCGMSSKRQVISILGISGIGKTTLAKTIYDDPLIVEYFHIRVWITISQDFNWPKGLLGVLDSINLMEQQLCLDDFTKVYKKLKGRRYLIVMDDVWSSKIWDEVRNALPDDNNGSRIVLTTRLPDVAVYPDSTCAPHEMRFMNGSESWDLLKGRVFANSDCPPELEDVGKKIARSCGGLPLAVVLVAGILSEVNNNPSSWEEIAENVNPIVGQELEEILSLSYMHLSHHLRSCFLFMAMFPEDENIRASRLIRLWVAEGFLKHHSGYSKSIEEEAEEYLEDLVKRNLVTVNSKKSDGKIKCCSLHDMVRDLCIRKAHDEKFLRVIHGHVIPQSMINERRISLRLSSIADIWCPTAHSMLCFEIQSFPSSPTFLRRFRLLRILDAVSQRSKELPSQVFELYHLKYLTLVCSYNVPSPISNLVNLQTLIILPTSDMPSASTKPKIIYARKIHGDWEDVSTKVSHFYLSLEIWRMSQLRHLISHCPCILPRLPDGSNLPLENIQTLAYIKDVVWTEKILQMIPNVKRLGLVYEIYKRCDLHLLKHLHHLQKLELFGPRSCFWVGQYNLLTIPRTLKKLTLQGGKFPFEDMSIIGSLPNLQVFKLRNQPFGKTWETTDGEFPQLRYLLIEKSGLQHWITESSHFPRLKHLVLRFCESLREVPQGIGEIPTLELIEVDSSIKSLLKSAKQIAEDQQSYGNYDLHVRASYFSLDEIMMREREQRWRERERERQQRQKLL